MVYLVGAGPGDPGLITVRGRALLSTCDAVVYDALADPALLVGLRAERHDVGKRVGSKPPHQRAANHPAMASDKNLVRFIHELH